MRFIRPLAAAFALGCFAAGAHATAFAEVKLTHFTGGINDQVLFDNDSAYRLSVLAQGQVDNFRVDSVGTPFQFSSRALTTGETFYVDVSYTITLRDDGGPSPSPGWLVPLSIPDGFTGFCEGAYAAVIPGLYNTSSFIPGVERSWQWIRFDTGDNLVPNEMTFSGVARGTYAVTDEHTPFPMGAVDVFVAVYAQSDLLAAPVPEPTTWAMLMGGLGLVGLARRRRR